MKLNPAKCSFGVGSGKFLGYTVTRHQGQPGANQGHPFNPFPEERQGGSKGNRKDGNFEQFISRLSHKSHAFFGTLKNPKDF